MADDRGVPGRGLQVGDQARVSQGVVDSEVLVERGPAVHRLDAALGVEEVLVGDLVLAEVLQGFRDDRHHRDARAAMTATGVVPMLGAAAAVRSAENYRALRRRGVTARKTTNVVIASFCLHVDLPLLFSDRDFQPFVDHLGLRAA